MLKNFKCCLRKKPLLSRVKVKNPKNLPRPVEVYIEAIKNNFFFDVAKLKKKIKALSQISLTKHFADEPNLYFLA